MASNTYWRCLVRPRTSNGMLLSLPRKSVHRATPATVAAFSSTAPASLPAPTQKKGGGKPVTKKGQKVSFSSKKVNARKRKGDRQEKGKPPAVGERKAFRKRIVLSNTNALAVDGLKELKEETVINGETHGQVLALSNDLIDQLRASEAFQAKQSWGMFRQPSMLIREDTLKIAKMFEGSKNVDKKQGTTRQILVGARGTGKSVYLLQAMAFAFLNKWTVIHIPDTRDLTIGHTDYSPIPGSRPTQYQTKIYTAALLQRIAKANPHLASLQLSQKHNLPIPVQENMSLDRFLQLGAAPEHSHAIFNAAMAELTAPGRPPMLLTLDNFARANELTEYKSAAFKPIHAHDFHLLSWFNRHLSGEAPLPNGGAVLAAMSANNSANVPALEMRLMQIEAHQKQASGTLKPGKDLTLPFLEATGQKPSPIPAADPYVRYDERVLGLLGGREVAIKGLPVEGGVEVKRVSGVNKDEARSLMEYWAKSGMLSARIDEGVVGQKWTLSGGGIVGELERSCFKMKL